MKKLLLLLAIPVALSVAGCGKKGCIEPVGRNINETFQRKK